jgi:hypothetical protein
VERDNLLAEKDAFHQRESLVAREKELAEKERELARLAAEYGSKIASLDVSFKSVSVTSPDNFVEPYPTVKC